MIYTIGGIKGGSGKTTLATNLAVMLANSGRDVLLVDADAQGTASDFSQQRSEVLEDIGYTAVKLSGNAVRTQIQKLKDKYDDIVIDAGGRDTTSQRAALVISDVFVAPFVPSSFDMWTLELVVALVQEMTPANPNLRAFAVLNSVDAVGKEDGDSKEYILETGVLEFMDTPIGRRKAFRKASSKGLAVTEFKPKDKKAIGEIDKFFDAILSINKLETSL